MKKTIAVCGSSGVGKTTVAKILTERTRGALRSCGEEVKQRAMQLGIEPSTLPSNEHAVIDSLTRELAQGTLEMLIVEGRFLDKVLQDVSNTFLVRLVCDDVIRNNRLFERQATSNLASVPNPPYAAEMITVSSDGIMQIDNSHLSAEETADRILRAWANLPKIPG
ncbi:MAG: AAA family ATPase [Prosthecobacter sp.]|uniref:AAA family ATPase n=1 Tax=Prosthecobacter sp. TaxID=1965333 RepID=UPI003BAE4491